MEPGRDTFNVEFRDFKVNTLPQEPLSLFQAFMPLFIIEKWVDYTNEWVAYLIENGVTDSWNHDLRPTSRLQKWEPTTTSEVYLFHGILIYIGIHTEITVTDYWKNPRSGEQLPTHPFIKFMPYNRFQLLYRHISLVRYTELQHNDVILLVFQYVNEWSDPIQKTSTELFCPGTHLAVDESMTRYNYRKKQGDRYIPSKPIPLGFKAWVVAQQGYFLRWIWHQPGANYGPVGVER